MSSTAPWTTELENQLLRALQGAWRLINDDFFRGGLTPPALALDDTVARLGQWHRSQRVLSLSRPLVRTRPWSVVREVLKHEMAHQYVDEVLGVHDESAHGPAFLRVCAERAIDARARGLPDDSGDSGDANGAGGAFGAFGAAGGGDDDDDRVMRRVQKLLALAESDNENEAEAAARAAQRLMLEHNIAARARTGRVYVTRAVSVPAVRLYAHERILAGLLGQHFFVEVVFCSAYLPDAARTGTYVELSGTRDNLAMAEWVHGFLRAAGERVCRHHIDDGTIVGRDRLRFLAGFMSGVSEKLTREAHKHSAEGLVWLGDPDLKGHVRQLHPRLYATSVRAVVTEAHVRGRQAGNDVVISRPVAAPIAERGRLLR